MVQRTLHSFDPILTFATNYVSKQYSWHIMAISWCEARYVCIKHKLLDYSHIYLLDNSTLFAQKKKSIPKLKISPMDDEIDATTSTCQKTTVGLLFT